MKDSAIGLMAVLFLMAGGLLAWDSLTTSWQKDREIRELQIKLNQTERTLLLQR